MNPMLFIILLGIIFVTISLFRFETRLAKRLRPRPNLPQARPTAVKFKEVDVLLELPDFTSLLKFAVTSGESLETALRLAVQRSSGLLSHEFEVSLLNVDHGALLQTELERMGNESESQHVRELAIKLALAGANGSSIADLLEDFVSSGIQELKAKMLERAGKNETKMMVPLVFVILPITVLFAVFPSLTLLQGSFL